MTIQNGPKKENMEAEVVEDPVEGDVMVEDEVLEKSDVKSTEEKAKDIESFSPGVIPQKDLDATRMYLNEIGFSPLLTAKEEVYYGRKVQAGDDEARKRMIESNLRLVVKIARRYMNRGRAECVG